MNLKNILDNYIKLQEIEPIKVVTLQSKQRRIKRFLNFLDDYPDSELNTSLLKRYHTSLHRKGLQASTIGRNLKEVKQAFKWAFSEGLIKYNSILDYKLPKQQQKSISYLNLNQVISIQNLQLVPRLQQVADLFIFQCYTGLAYVDLMAFDYSKNTEVVSSTLLLKMPRSKSNVEAKVPLLPEAQRILAKYHYKLPTISNQKYNKYLKEVGTAANIRLPLTSHIGRKTAATLYLNAGVSLKAVAQALGHTSTRTTERYYAALQTETLLKEFEKVK
jgi:site-specific recombinase XerD